MDPNLLYAVISGIIFVAVIVFWLLYSVIKNRKVVATLKKQLRNTLTEDLELATSDQLMQELRRRPSHPYILLLPIKSPDQQGISVEIHGLAPVLSLGVLKMATMVTTKELLERGVEIPDNVGDEFLPPEFPESYDN